MATEVRETFGFENVEFPPPSASASMPGPRKARAVQQEPSGPMMYGEEHLEDKENMDPVSSRALLALPRTQGDHLFKALSPGEPERVESDSRRGDFADVSTSKSPLPENYPRSPLQDITAVLYPPTNVPLISSQEVSKEADKQRGVKRSPMAGHSAHTPYSRGFSERPVKRHESSTDSQPRFANGPQDSARCRTSSGLRSFR